MNTQTQKRLRNKGRYPYKFFVMFPWDVLNHETFRTLSPRATKLVVDIAAQYRGSNNGDLSATLNLMRDRGWNSSDQLDKAKKELVGKDVIRVARQGGLNKCNLYALTWFPIDECKGKLDIASTITAPVDWKIGSPDPSSGS
ncbi:MAG TPA: hypothetical protein EYN10_07230 [Gammaproteobacteria bacterium]|nr:hypothetical protein [Gammaproteobacteria bacterium]